MLYNEAKAIFSKCRNKAVGARLDGRFTRLVAVGSDFGIQYHNTVVVTIHANGKYTLNTGGFFTKTTKERINTYSPASIYSHKSVWYLAGDGKEYTGKGQRYSDGVTVNSKGKVTKAPNAKQATRIDGMLKRIDEYTTKYADALKAGTIPTPSGADCWGCCMHDTATGKPVFDNGHLESHLDEGYLVPSLLVNAIKAKGYNPAFVNPWNGLRNDVDTFKRAIKSYLRKELVK